MTKPRVQLKIENFGPIVEGTVEFKPLTFLIGPNNSGKSYVATILYALSRALQRIPRFSFPGPITQLDEISEFVMAESQRWNEDLPVNQIPPVFWPFINEYMSRMQSQLPQDVEDAIRQYFSVNEVAGLTRLADQERLILSVVSSGSTPNQSQLRITSDKYGSHVEFDLELPERLDHRAQQLFSQVIGRPQSAPMTIFILLWDTLLEESGYWYSHSHYLPAARSGMLESWPMLASLAVRRASVPLSRQQPDVPLLAGVVGDFLQAVIEQLLPRTAFDDRRSALELLDPALDLLERQLLNGRVVLDEGRPGTADLVYESERLRVPLQRASSMIAELAPLDLWVREILDPNDLLIIDEPESHLHPENQRLIARILVRLVNAGVGVVAPTHSSTILHQVSNLLLASDLDEESRAKLGFTDHDRISPDDVAVYLFERRADGTHIVPVPIEPGFGISEEEFVRVSEAIGDETFRLTFAAAQQPA